VDENPDHGLLYQEGADWAPMFPEGYRPISTPQGPVSIAPRKGEG
jgi:hypothetical protein